MTQLSNGIYEDDLSNLTDAAGKIIVPKEQRVKTEVYSRIVGYLRPVSGWNKGKKAEFKDRAVFVTPKVESGEVREGSDA